MYRKRTHSPVDHSNLPSTKPKRPRNDESGPDITQKLPTTVLANIIHLLPKAQWPHLELVNRGFQSAVHDAWRKVKDIHFEYDFKLKMYGSAYILNLLLKKLLDRAANIQSLDGFTAFPTYGLDERIIDLLSEFEKLQKICFPTGMRSTTLARLLSTSMSRGTLKELSQSGELEGGSTELELAFDQHESKPPLQLEKFLYKLCSWDRLRPEDIFFNHIDVTKMTTLSLDVHDSNKAAVTSLLDRCTKLANLQLDISCSKEFGPVLEAAAVSPGLCTLKFKYTSVGRSEFYSALENLIRNLGGRPYQLTELSLNDCDNNIVQAITNHLTGLVSLKLNISICGTDLTKQLLMNLKRLESLRVKLDSPELGELAPFMVELTNLKYLGIEICGLYYYSKFGYVDILSDFVPLKELRIRLSWNATGGIFTKFAKKGLPHLERLRIYLSNRRMDKAIAAFLGTLPGLRRLHLEQKLFSSVSDQILMVIAKSCPLLNELDIPDQDVSLNGIQSIIDGCSRLKKVHLKNSGINNRWYPDGLKVAKYKKIAFK